MNPSFVGHYDANLCIVFDPAFDGNHDMRENAKKDSRRRGAIEVRRDWPALAETRRRWSVAIDPNRPAGFLRGGHWSASGRLMTELLR